MENEELVIMQNDLPAYEQSVRAEIDIQIATAKRYPRDLTRFMKNVVFTCTMTEQAALSCGYTLPRGDKKIQGASVHLARILAQNFGNIRVSAKGIQTTDKYVIAEAVCMDLESNVAVRVEMRQKILDKSGKRYNEDMINVTMLATISKAERNAILHVIPKAFVDEAYQAAQEKILSGLSDKGKLETARAKAMKLFKDKFGVEEKVILGHFGKEKVEQLDKEDIVSLRGLYQALLDGDATVQATFGGGDNQDGEKSKAKAENFEREESDAAKQPVSDEAVDNMVPGTDTQQEIKVEKAQEDVKAATTQSGELFPPHTTARRRNT